ncbi:hypothetical protein HK100_004170 [Physocladia obscura]|uniref:Gelsolin-like domain-containing protein n=1 Tax=Physocladia obscura TaxID=109957 RepID=A0AAD5SVR7_9FUNG|nr:hypothetical protein HK100_004170 [Physocladia obscura]
MEKHIATTFPTTEGSDRSPKQDRRNNQSNGSINASGFSGVAETARDKRASTIQILGARITSFFSSSSSLSSSLLLPSSPTLEAGAGAGVETTTETEAETNKNSVATTATTSGFASAILALRSRSNSAHRIQQRVSTKITDPVISHGAYLYSQNTSLSSNFSALVSNPESTRINPVDFYHADFSFHAPSIENENSKPPLPPIMRLNDLMGAAFKSSPHSVTLETKSSLGGNTLVGVATGQSDEFVKRRYSHDGDTATFFASVVPSNSNNTNTSPPTISVTALLQKQQQTSPISPKSASAPLNQQKQRQQQKLASIDVSDILPIDFTSSPALTRAGGRLILRIDNMRPEIVTERYATTVGVEFCVADCYIIIATDELNGGQGGGIDSSGGSANVAAASYEPRLTHRVWTWIGDVAEIDKQFCCAMYAVGIKSKLNGRGNIARQTQGQETREFRRLFGVFDDDGRDLITYADSSCAAESGLFIAEAKRFALRVYCVHTTTKRTTINNEEQNPDAKASDIYQPTIACIRMTLVAPIRASLKSNHVYFIDAGMTLVQWNGRYSTEVVRAKCRLIRSIVKTGPDRAVPPASAAAGAIVSDFEFYEGDGEQTLESILGREKYLSPAVDDDGDGKVHFATLYKVPFDSGKISGSLQNINDFIVAKAESDFTGFSQLALNTSNCFILDLGTEIYLWVGEKARTKNKTLASEILTNVIRESPKRPSYLLLHRITQHSEPEPFKLHFPDWIEPRVRTLTLPIYPPLPPRIEVQTLYTPHPHNEIFLLPSNTALNSDAPDDNESSRLHQNALPTLQAMQATNALLSVFHAFSYQHGRFIKITGRERGGVHVCSGSVYAFLCVYKGCVDGDNDDGSRCLAAVADDDDILSQLNETVSGAGFFDVDRRRLSGGGGGGDVAILSTEWRQRYPAVESFANIAEGVVISDSVIGGGMARKHCVVYFWVGSSVSLVGERMFRFQARVEVQDAVRSLYGDDCGVKIVHVEQGREPLELLAHWGNRSIVHSGTRNEFEKQDGISGGGVSGAGSMFHIRTDIKFGTTRAIQVSPVSSVNLISRDCFYVHSEDASIPGFLWTGKNCTRDDARKAQAICDRLSAFYEPVPLSSTSTVTMSESSIFLSADENIGEPAVKHGIPSMMNAKKFRIVAEGLEPRAFWELFPQGKQIPYCTGPLLLPSLPASSPALNWPRLLICSCARGYFNVQEEPYYDKQSLNATTCVILDPGIHSPVYLWIGTRASNVAILMSRKAVEVWVDTHDDKNGTQLQQRRQQLAGIIPGTGEVVARGVIQVDEGHESREFRSMFHGWV